MDWHDRNTKLALGPLFHRSATGRNSNVVTQDFQTNSPHFLVDEHLERDARVQEAYRDLRELLAVLEDVQLQEEPAGPIHTLSFDDAELSRWFINIAGEVNLERLSHFCSSLIGWSNVLDARVNDISSGSITIRLLTRGGIEMEPLSRAIRELRTSRGTNSTAEFNMILASGTSSRAFPVSA
jgi:hypothetical protein